MATKTPKGTIGMCDCGRVGSFLTGKGYRCKRCIELENRYKTGDVAEANATRRERLFWYESGIGSRELREFIYALDRWLIAHGEDPHRYEFNRYKERS